MSLRWFHLSGTRARRELEDFFSGGALATAALLLAGWAASHGAGIGFVVDTALLALALATIGRAALDGFDRLVDFVQRTLSLRTQVDIDAAADLLAQAIAIFGVGLFRAILRKAGRNNQRNPSGSEGTPGHAPEPPKPSTPSTQRPRQSPTEQPKAAKEEPKSPHEKDKPKATKPLPKKGPHRRHDPLQGEADRLHQRRQHDDRP